MLQCSRSSNSTKLNDAGIPSKFLQKKNLKTFFGLHVYSILRSALKQVLCVNFDTFDDALKSCSHQVECL